MKGKERHLWPFFFCILLACHGAPKQPTGDEARRHQALRQQCYADTVYPAFAAAVQTGDLVARLGSDITSDMLRQMNQTDKTFSHCGIASIENDTVFIYHAIGGEFNPNQRIKREPLFSYGHSTENKGLGLFRLEVTEAARQAVAKLARQYYLAGIPFDMAFDYASEDRFYCAEYVAKCVSRGVADSSWLHFSAAGRFRYVAIDNLLLTPMARSLTKKMY